MSENKKSPLKKAILEAREIEKAAIEGARKVLEESVVPKIEEAVKETVQELENEKSQEQLQEGVTIEVGDANVEVNVEDGVTSIEVDAEEEDIDISSDGETDMDADLDSDEDEDLDSDMDLDSEDEDEDEEDDIFEITGINEEDMEAPIEDAAAEAAPAEEAEVDLDVDMGGDDAGFPGLEDLSSKLDTIISKLDGAETNAEEAGEMAPEVGEEAPEAIGAEGEVEIVDDEAAAAEAPAEAPEEEVVAEDDFLEISFEEDDNMFEIDLEETMDEIEVVDGDEELEEMKMMGQSNSVQKTAGESAGPEIAVKNRGRNINENTQQETNVVELEKENESLRKSLKEYKESFIVLRKQINEVQAFNAKLAYVNKLFSKGGLTNDEKVQIAEQFDGVKTVEQAKELYNNIISENKTFIKESKADKMKNKLKSVAPATTPSTKTETLYESKEISRMKELAGIKKLNG